MTLWGVDISNRQKGAVLARTKAAGATWVYAKASEGVTFTDAQFAGYRAQARAAGLLFGAYHFARPSSTRRPADEAAHFLNCVGSVQVGELPPALDLEVTGDLGPAALSAWALEWLRLVEHATGVRPMLYSSRNFAAANLTAPALAGYRLWLAAYQARTPKAAPPWRPDGWTFWQHTSSARVPGIPGLADRNLTSLSPASLLELRRPPAAAPAPRPVVVPPARPAVKITTRPPARPLPTRPAPAPVRRPATADVHALGSRTITEGDKGSDVAFVQRFLGLTDDGDFGPVTLAAVEHYQAVHLLANDGVIGPKTWGLMLSAVAH